MEKCILIDGSGLIYRGFYAVPPFMKHPTTGAPINAVYGFTSILLTIIQSQKPDYLAVAFDKKGPTFRHKEYAEYKATRVKAPDELYSQIPLVKEVVSAFGLPQFEVESFEADDILATITKELAPNKNVEVLIATGDFDMFQIAGERVSILYPTKGFRGAEIMRVPDIEAKYQLQPSQIPDYKGLAGDSSDNIPGVRGIGDKGATMLLKKYGGLEGIYEHLDEITGSMHKKLSEGKESAFKCRSLATLVDTVPMNFELEKCRVKDFDVASISWKFAELGFKSLQERLDEIYDDVPSEIPLDDDIPTVSTPSASAKPLSPRTAEPPESLQSTLF